MLLEGKNAIVYGTGPLGAGVARTFAREGARVFVAGRTRERVEAVAAEIAAAGGSAEGTVLDALDERAVDEHAAGVVARAGSIDVSFNLTSREDVQARPVIELSVEELTRAPQTALTSNFVTARAAARRMVEQGSGVILSLTSGTARAPSAGMGNTGPADAGVEVLMRTLAYELGPSGVRVLGIYTAAVAETLTTERMAKVTGQEVPVDAVLAGVAQGAMLKRPPALEHVASTAAFLASDRAADITGTIVNVSCGLVPG
jgi:NAD(P)-dependent dehydrogenase (short-subunit alcohol dehydrogenase family)